MNSRSKYSKSLQRTPGPIAPVSPRGAIIREILEALVEDVGADFDSIQVTLKSHLEMGLTDVIKGVKLHQFMVDIHERDEAGKFLKEEVCLKNGHCLSFAAIGESEEELKLTLAEIYRARRWGVTLEDLRNGITCGEVLLRHGIDPGVVRRGLDVEPELN